MQHFSIRRIGRLVAAALAFTAMSASQVAFAAGPIVATATVSVSNLQIQMTDFRPDDGIAAGGTWQEAGTGWMTSYCCNTADYRYGNEIRYDDRFIDVTPRTLSGSSDIVSVSRMADGAQASFTLYGEDAPLIQYGGKWDPSSAPVASASYNGYGFRLSINPGTEITLTGLSTVDGSMNLLNDKANRRVVGVLDMAAEFEMFPWDSRQGIEVLAKPESQSAFPGGSIVQTKSGQSLSGDSELHESGSFTYVLRNTSQGVRTVGFDLYVRAYFSEYSLPVPEPATWALMLTGVAVAGLSARRRQAA